MHTRHSGSCSTFIFGCNLHHLDRPGRLKPAPGGCRVEGNDRNWLGEPGKKELVSWKEDLALAC